MAVGLRLIEALRLAGARFLTSADTSLEECVDGKGGKAIADPLRKELGVGSEGIFEAVETDPPGDPWPRAGNGCFPQHRVADAFLRTTGRTHLDPPDSGSGAPRRAGSGLTKPATCHTFTPTSVRDHLLGSGGDIRTSPGKLWAQ